MVIYEREGFSYNELYKAAQIYLPDRITNDIHRLKVGKNKDDNKINVTIELNEEFTDIYNEIKYKWCLVRKKMPTKDNYDNDVEEQLAILLTFHRKHKDLVINEYLPYILKYSETNKQQDKTLKLFVADRFVERRDYYRKVGKAWKRGYLLYGPPGTGKSSLIAAIANYLNFDIYDLELTGISSNYDMRRLLLNTANRSILVVEDIDCSVQLHNRDNTEAAKSKKKGKITLSGFLNFVDGLWSSCGNERIIIFTTNRKDKLDSALLRPGRMDLHIHMTYCTPSGFRLLASNYHNLTQHNLFEEIDDLIRKVEITPAEVAEQLLVSDDPDIALRGLIKLLEVKKKENEEAKIKAKEEERLKSDSSDSTESNSDESDND